MKLLRTPLFEMANLRISDTGLPVNIWLDEAGVQRNVQHAAPRLKFQNNYSEKADPNNLIPISISTHPQVLAGTVRIKNKDLNTIKTFIILNESLLKEHWNGDISTIKMYSQLLLPTNCDQY